MIIDDEPIAQDIIFRYLQLYPSFTVVAKCKNANEANHILTTEGVHLIFLDIEMPGIDGLSFVKTLKHPPKVIITTAYREYALDGYDLNVIDYLLKPISEERFMKSINHFFESQQNEVSNVDYTYIKADKKMVQVFYDDILYIEGLSNYVKVVTKHTTIISYHKLSYLEAILPKELFIRAHRSFIVGTKNIKAFTTANIEIGTTQLPIGGIYKDKVLEWLKKFQT